MGTITTSPPASREPPTRLVVFGNLEDILNSQASPQLKAACIEMDIEASASRGPA